MQTRGRKIVREISQRKTRTVLVSLSIFIGVLGVVMLFSMRDIMVGSFEDSIDLDNMEMIRVYASINTDQPPNNEALLATLRNLPDMEAVMGVAINRVYMRDGDGFRESFVFAFSDPLDELPLEAIERIDGRAPVAGQREIAVERRLTSTYDVSLNDEIIFRVGDEDETTNFQRAIIDNSAYVPIFTITEDPKENSVVALVRSSGDAMSMLALGLLVPVLAAVMPVLTALRVRITTAITDLGITSTYRSEGVIGRVSTVVPVPINLRQSLHNINRKKGRMALNIFTLGLAAGSFMGVFAVLDSLNTVGFRLENTFGHQIAIATIASLWPALSAARKTISDILRYQ